MISLWYVNHKQKLLLYFLKEALGQFKLNQIMAYKMKVQVVQMNFSCGNTNIKIGKTTIVKCKTIFLSVQPSVSRATVGKQHWHKPFKAICFEFVFIRVNVYEREYYPQSFHWSHFLQERKLILSKRKYNRQGVKEIWNWYIIPSPLIRFVQSISLRKQ